MRPPAPVLALMLAALTSGPARGAGPDDPFYASRGSWGQDYDDQWALKRVGFTPPGAGDSAWEREDGSSRSVLVAVLDTGIDYHHPDLDRKSIWRNPGEEPNGVDDDGNGFVDDVIGWNFVEHSNDPWDFAGHGTHIAGVIAAATNNAQGIAGVNRGAVIMPLKVMNFVGRGRSTGISQAVFYAVAHGARVINLSLGSHHLSKTEQLALDHARGKGVVVVAAAGNEGIDTADYGPAGLEGVITVAASGLDDDRAGFSNWGDAVDLLAPGIDVLSLRARRTDFTLVSGQEGYTAGDGFVGPENRYYRATGTSFAAPFVAGVASLLFARDPDLSAEQVTRMILHSARDVGVPGVDRFTGYGLLDAPAALAADPEFFVEARIAGVEVVQEGGQTFVRVLGRADANAFGRAWVEIGQGEEPGSFERASEDLRRPVPDGALVDLEAGRFAGARAWTLRLVTEHADGTRREARFLLRLG